jgi:hypothetical protein
MTKKNYIINLLFAVVILILVCINPTPSWNTKMIISLIACTWIIWGGVTIINKLSKQ